MLKLIAILIAALAAPVLAAVPTVSVISQTVNENAGTATIRIIRTGDLSKPSQIGFKTINGTALAGVNFTYRSGGVWFPALTNSYRFTVPILVDHKVTPDLKFTVRLSAVLNAQLLGGTITIHNTDQPPPPPPVVCPDGTTVPAGQTCPAPPPPAAGPFTAWVAAPLTVGGYACNRLQENTPNIGPCGSSIVYKITGAMMSTDAVPVQQYTTVFFQDLSGNYPKLDVYWANRPGIFAATDLDGIAPTAAAQWKPAPLMEGGFARAKLATPGWPKGLNPTANQYNYADVYRSVDAGEIVRIYKGGWGYSWDNRVTFSSFSVLGGDTVILYADELDGVAPGP